MKSIKLLGYFDGISGAEGVREIDCKISIDLTGDYISSNLELDEKLMNLIERIKTLIRSDIQLFDNNSLIGNIGLNLEFKTDPEISKLEDVSYGLPLYAVILGELINTDINKKIFGTGNVLSDGTIGSVSKVIIKNQKALNEYYAELFLYPSTMKGYGVEGIPVSTALSGFLIWSGVDFFYSYCSNVNNPDTFYRVFANFLEGFANGLLPSDFGFTFRTILKTNENIRNAYLDNKHEWIVLCLRNTFLLPTSCFSSVLQVIDPINDLNDNLNSPILRDRFINDILDSIKEQTERSAIDSIFALASFILLLSKEIQIVDLMKSSTSLRRKLMDIRDLSINHSINEDERQKVYAVIELNISKFFQDVSIIEDQYEKIPNNEIALSIRTMYHNNEFISYEYSFPSFPQIEPIELKKPAALYDSSRNLPLLLKRNDWNEEMSGIENTQFGSDFQTIFGKDNEFVFPSFINNGFETRVMWGDGTGTWPPSIDTLHLIGSLAKHNILGRDKHYDRVLDLGCGTGILGIILAKNSNVEFLDFMDIEPSAVLTTRNNVFSNFNKFENKSYSESDFMKGETQYFEECAVTFKNINLSNPINEKYDLLICTPPYVPYLNILNDPLMWRAVSGTDLLKFVLVNAKNISKRCIIQFSDIALPEIGEYIQDAHQLDISYVGFRIPPLLKYFSGDGRVFHIAQNWYNKVSEHLIDTEKTNIEVIKNNHHGFKFFHAIRTYLIE